MVARVRLGPEQLFASTPAGGGIPALTPVPNVYTVPRIGFDYVVAPNITVGGDLVIYFTLGGNGSTETQFSNGNTQTNSMSQPELASRLRPRTEGGLHHAPDRRAQPRLRGGFSYYTATSKFTTTTAGTTSTTSDNFDQLGLDLEPQLVIHPFPHVGFTVGLDADIPLTGGISETTTTGANKASESSHASLFFMGLAGGMLVWF